MKPKKRVVVIGLKGLPAFGGASSVGENLIEHLKDEFDFTVLSVTSHTQIENINVNGVEQIIFKKIGNGGLNTLIYYFKCLFHCLFNKYDLIHLHHAESGFITPLLRLRYPVITTFHGLYRENDPKFSILQNKFFRFSEKLNIKFSNRIISVSKPDQEYILAKYNKQIDYIPNGINIEINIKKQKDVEKYIFFAAGRIYQIKGLHLLLNALKNKNIKLIVAGDLNQVDEYKQEILDLSKKLDIEFLGLIKDKNKLMEYIANSDLFIFPSLTEAMSMMLLEVVSIKTPIIASDIDANTSIFSDQEILFFKNNDIDDLSAKIDLAINQQKLMEVRAENAFNKLKNNYTWEKSASLYKQIYNSF